MLVRTLAGAESDATTIRYRSGMVSDANDEGKSFDIIYDDTTFDAVGSGAVGEEDDEEDGVAADRVVATSISPSLSCAARLNLARCAYRGGRHAEVQWKFKYRVPKIGLSMHLALLPHTVERRVDRLCGRRINPLDAMGWLVLRS